MTCPTFDAEMQTMSWIGDFGSEKVFAKRKKKEGERTQTIAWSADGDRIPGSLFPVSALGTGSTSFFVIGPGSNNAS